MDYYGGLLAFQCQAQPWTSRRRCRRRRSRRLALAVAAIHPATAATRAASPCAFLSTSCSSPLGLACALAVAPLSADVVVLSPSTLGGILGGVLAFLALVAMDAFSRVRRYFRRRAAQNAAAAAAASSWKAYVVKDGELVLGDAIGAGGSGVVHQAAWKGTQVACKVISSPPAALLAVPAAHKAKRGLVVWLFASQRTAESDVVDGVDPTLAREVEFLGKLRHPNILSVYAVQLQPPLLVMELGTGGSLLSLLYGTTLTTFSWPQRVAMGVGVASGIAFLHAQKPPIIHQCLKRRVLGLVLSPLLRSPGGDVIPAVPKWCWTRCFAPRFVVRTW